MTPHIQRLPVVAKAPLAARRRIASVAIFLMSVFGVLGTATAQSLEVKRYNYAEWAKPYFSEVVTVTGPGKMIYLGGVGAEDEDRVPGPAGLAKSIRHVGDPYQQCKYAFDKIKRLLAKHGATLHNVVKQLVYITDPRFFIPHFEKCKNEEYGGAGAPLPAQTLVVTAGLANAAMLVEIDITAVVPK